VSVSFNNRAFFLCFFFLFFFFSFLFFFCFVLVTHSCSLPDGKTAIDVQPAIAEDNSLRTFPFDVLARATDNFHEHNRIGEGGFGAVFRGTLPDGTDIAVKRLEQDEAMAAAAGLPTRDQLKAERRVLHQFPHPNLVQLMGVSSDGIPCLVYPLMRGGSLASRFRRPPPLALALRLRIALDICRALAHVHLSANEVFQLIKYLEVVGSQGC
jgi:hypothetical protein